MKHKSKVTDYLVDDKYIYNIEYKFVKLLGYLSKIATVLFLFGFFQEEFIYFIEFNFFIKILFACFLIYRFNSYRKHKIRFTDLDRKVAYSAGIYIFLLSLVDLVIYFGFVKINDKIMSFIPSSIKKIQEKSNSIKNSSMLTQTTW
jgi:hypothetical protein